MLTAIDTVEVWVWPLVGALGVLCVLWARERVRRWRYRVYRGP